ncbi:hypothetical protein IWZ01DRAFT_245147 [Phyllosticta capitalensis]
MRMSKRNHRIPGLISITSLLCPSLANAPPTAPVFTSRNATTQCLCPSMSARQTSSPVLAACNARPSLGIACFDRVSPPVPVLPDHIVWRPISKTSFAGGIGLCGTIFIDKSCKPFNCASIRSRALLSPIPLLYLPLDWPSIC